MAQRRTGSLHTSDNMNKATIQLQLDLDGAEILSSDSKEASKYQENNMSVCSKDLDLSLDEYKSDRRYHPENSKQLTLRST